MGGLVRLGDRRGQTRFTDQNKGKGKDNLVRRGR